MRDGVTGHLFEEEVLGRCAATYRGYLKFHEAAELVRKSQPATMRPAAENLRKEVAKRFGKWADGVRFYTAVRSSLDVFHGVDCFFEFNGVVVTIDVTINPDKVCGKADLVVSGDDFKDLPILAARIAREFATKIKRR